MVSHQLYLTAVKPLDLQGKVAPKPPTPLPGSLITQEAPASLLLFPSALIRQHTAKSHALGSLVQPRALCRSKILLFQDSDFQVAVLPRSQRYVNILWFLAFPCLVLSSQVILRLPRVFPMC